jgi:AcrR family transcriptional regulator
MTPPHSPPPATEPAPSPARRGRPRDPERSRAILDAARSLLREGGWEALTIEAVANRAGVGRPTVYRRWPTKGHLAAEVLGMELNEHGEPVQDRRLGLPDTGSLRGDLLALAQVLIDRLAALEKKGILPGVVSEMALDEELAHQVRASVLVPDRERVTEVVHRAAERGELRDHIDASLVIDTLSAVVIYFTTVVHEPPSSDQVEQVVDLIADGCTA